ncbi:HAD family hydrolase [Olivibacter sitiensis]|uniref:HAD family hydrolase n=1 Tax=Olivibacter sitiensis TaxID=376470 RepID=UPI000423EC27|nr:HAD family phosphatase [Olivibacter sitiensis]
MQNIKNIIFDYGNVIFKIDFKKAQDAFRDLGIKDVEKVFTHTSQSELFDAFDMGKISAVEFRDGIRRITGKANLSDEEIDRAWNALLIGVVDGAHDLLLQLKDKYHIFLLSNNNEIHYKYIMDYLKREFDLDGNAGFFIKDYYSHLMGMRKPNSDIFEYVLKAHGLQPEETLFIDDSPQHIATAKQLDIHAELLTAPDTLELLLTRKGIV